MGIFNSLFGLNTANATNADSAAAQGLIGSTSANNYATLNNQAQLALGNLSSGAANASSAINQNYGAGANALTGYGSLAQALLSGGTNQAVGTALAGNSAFQPAASTGGAASGALANALGINGASGDAAATSAFQASPGYQYQLGQSTQNAERAAAATGSLGSGNTLTAITQLGSNLANSEYQSYLGNLSNAATQGLAGATGLSANDKTASGYQSTGATTGATLAQGTGSALGTLDLNQGNQLGNLANALGINTANTNTELGNSLASNAWQGALSTAGLLQSQGAADDKVSNANSSIFSSLLGKGLSSAFSGGSSSLGGGLLSALL